MTNRKILFALLAITFSIAACKKDEPDDQNNSFDRAAMLVEYRDVFIKPAFNNALQKAETLELAASAFTTNPSIEQLAPVQNAWIDAAIAWQSACWYNFGPAGEAGIKKSIQEEIATFPVSLTKLNTILTSGTWNLNDFNRDARGFFAIEYLLFDASLTPEQVSERFQNDVYRNFLNALCLDLKTRILEVKNAWNSYGSEFTSNAGTDAGSSVSMMYNEFVKSYEGLKNFKFGLPLGLRPGQTAVDPTLLEARFSRISFRLARAHYNALVNFYRGVDQTKSFKGYLKTVTGGEALVTTTEAQLSVLNTQFNNLDENLDMETRILNDPQALIDIHTELQKNTKNFKSDMSSLLGIAITYASGDGD
jgi:predicted lipoprotein